MLQHKSKIDLVVIAIIILAVVLGVGLAVNRIGIFKETRNLTRYHHMQLLMTAIYSYIVDYGVFPNCIPEPGQPAVKAEECYEELSPYLINLVIKEPGHPKYNYMIEYISGEEDGAIRIFSTAPEAENLEVIR